MRSLCLWIIWHSSGGGVNTIRGGTAVTIVCEMHSSRGIIATPMLLLLLPPDGVFSWSIVVIAATVTSVATTQTIGMMLQCMA